jgi:hypothetical protein
MRRLALLVLLAGIALRAFAARGVTAQKVTVEQLEQLLATAHRQRDAKAARQIYALELTERMSAAQLARAEADLPGPASRRALLAVTDTAAFLDLPAADLSTASAPDRAAQISLLAQTIEYARKTISRLPNFFATRDTTRFEGTQAETLPSGMNAFGYQPLHEVDRSSVEVFYRDGRESFNAEASNRKGHRQSIHELRTIGEFGPILVATLGDAVKGKVVWGHWEQGAAGLEAVFRYEVPAQASRYAVAFPGFSGPTEHYPAYHGEIAVDPADGSILRVTMVADLKPDDPVAAADILVEYGPVTIGGKNYICPVKSVALAQFPATEAYPIYNNSSSSPELLKIQVNDTLFEKYHLFRTEMRILPADSMELKETPPAFVPATSPSPAPATPPEH